MNDNPFAYARHIMAESGIRLLNSLLTKTAGQHKFIKQ